MIHEEDIKLIKRFIEIRNKGHFVNGNELADVYNRVLNKNVRPSNCSSCCRQRVNELEAALKAYEQALEAQKKQDVDNSPTEDNKASGEAENKSVKKSKKTK